MYFWVLAVLSACLFGASTPAEKLLLNSFSAAQLAGLLYLGAALGVSIPILSSRRGFFEGRLNRANLFRLAGSILFGGILGPLFLLWGLRLASAASVSLWLNLELVATVLLGQFLFRDRIGKMGWIGAVFIAAGALVLSRGEGDAGWASGLFLGVACLCWGLDNHFTALIDGILPIQSTFWKGLVAGVTTLVLGLWTADFLAGPIQVGEALLTGALAYGASIVLYITAAQALGAVRGQMVYAAAPFFGLVFSRVFLGEALNGAHAVAAICQLTGLFFVFRDKHGHAHVHEEMVHTHLHSHDDGHHTHEHSGQSKIVRHSHPHRHGKLVHSHLHWPDLHHRHVH